MKKDLGFKQITGAIMHNFINYPLEFYEVKKTINIRPTGTILNGITIERIKINNINSNSENGFFEIVKEKSRAISGLLDAPNYYYLNDFTLIVSSMLFEKCFDDSTEPFYRFFDRSYPKKYWSARTKLFINPVNENSSYTLFISLDTFDNHKINKKVTKFIENNFVVLVDDDFWYVHDYVAKEDILRISTESYSSFFTSFHMSKIITKFADSKIYVQYNGQTKIFKITNKKELTNCNNNCIHCASPTNKEQVLVPCGHTSLCKECIDVSANETKKCLICDGVVEKVINIK
jgi:hypothetical protein